MVTDNSKSTSGVPSSTPFSRQRMQLVKPQQTTNSGLVQSKAIQTGNPSQHLQMNSNGQYYLLNPLLKRTDGGANPVVTGQSPSSATPSYGYKTDFTDANGDTLYSDPGFLGQGAMATTSNFDQAKAYIGKLTDDEIIALLNELADGTLKGYDRTETHDPATTEDDVYIPAGQKSSTTSFNDLLALKGGQK